MSTQSDDGRPAARKTWRQVRWLLVRGVRPPTTWRSMAAFIDPDEPPERALVIVRRRTADGH